MICIDLQLSGSSISSHLIFYELEVAQAINPNGWSFCFIASQLQGRLKLIFQPIKLSWPTKFIFNLLCLGR
jgi:hypothetical protein